MQWYEITLSWEEVSTGKHRDLASSIEKCYRRKTPPRNEQVEIKMEPLIGGYLRLYASPGVATCAKKVMKAEHATVCPEPPAYLPTFLSLSGR